MKLRRFLIALAAAVLTATITGSAKADSCTLTGINTPATATIEITSLTNNLLTFTVTNTSTGPVTGKITGFGLDLPGATGTFTLISTTNNNFELVMNINGNAAGIGRVFEVALITGPNFNGGDPNDGIWEGVAATFSISGNFTGFSQQQILANFFARFQDVNVGGGSDVARCCEPPPPSVPEPAAMALLGSGLAGVAMRLRRRRRQSSE